MATKKTDSPTVHDNLDALASELDAKEGVEQYAFSFGGVRFVCENPYDGDLAEATSLAEDDLLGQIKQYLGADQYEKFMSKKPKLRHAAALLKRVQDYYSETYGNPGESGGSPTS